MTSDSDGEASAVAGCRVPPFTRAPILDLVPSAIRRKRRREGRFYHGSGRRNGSVVADRLQRQRRGLGIDPDIRVDWSAPPARRSVPRNVGRLRATVATCNRHAPAARTALVAGAEEGHL